MRPPVGSRAAALVGGIALLVAGCGGAPAAPSGKIRVVTAFYPLEEVVRRVGGPLADVSNLTPPGAEPHDLELRPSDVRRLQGADLVLYLADGFQPALEAAIRALPDPARALDLLAGMPLRPAAEKGEAGQLADPHVWLSPPLMERIVDAVSRAMASRAPQQAPDILRRAALLRAELAALDEEYLSRLSRCERRDIFTSHAAFAYLADRYGLRQIAITGLSPEAEPSSRRLREVAGMARASGATTVFFETLVDSRVAQAVARIVGAATAVLNPIEGLTPEERVAGADYFSIMRRNLAALVKALGCVG
jgi:zinc transport system substrate-binding protein